RGMVSGSLRSDAVCPNGGVFANVTLKFGSTVPAACEPIRNGLQIKCVQIKTRPKRADATGGRSENCHGQSARWRRAIDRPLPAKAGARLRAVHAERSGSAAAIAHARRRAP